MRQDQHIISVNIDGIDFGWFDKLEGGEIDSEESKYKPAGMPHVSLGGPVEVGNLTVSRLFVLGRDDGMERYLKDRVGRAKVTLAKFRTDQENNLYGQPLVYTGTLKTVTPPEADSESSDAALIELEITPAGAIG